MSHSIAVVVPKVALLFHNNPHNYNHKEGPQGAVPNVFVISEAEIRENDMPWGDKHPKC